MIWYDSYNEQTNMFAAGVSAGVIADLVWSSSASSCKLTETIPAYNAMFGVHSDSATFEFDNLPGSGDATTPLIEYHYATAYGPDQWLGGAPNFNALGPLGTFYTTSGAGPNIGLKHKFTINCGGQTASVTAYQDEDEIRNIRSSSPDHQDQALLNAGYRRNEFTHNGPVKVDVVYSYHEETTRGQSHTGFQRIPGDNPLFPTRCVDMFDSTIRVCGANEFFVSLNATNCRTSGGVDAGLIGTSFFDGAHYARPGPHLTVSGQPVVLPPAYNTGDHLNWSITCTGPTGSASYRYHINADQN